MQRAPTAHRLPADAAIALAVAWPLGQYLGALSAVTRLESVCASRTV